MRLFQRNYERAASPVDDERPVWPDDSLSDIDDDAFARAIADGRKAEEHEQLIEA